MKNITQTFQLFNWGELNDRIKPGLIEIARDTFYEAIENQDLGDEINGFILTQLNLAKSNGAVSAKTLGELVGLKAEWSLSNAQGDGVAIYGTINSKDAPDLPWGEITTAKLVRNSWGIHYTHQNCFEVTCYADDLEIPAAEVQAVALWDALRDVCNATERYGYNVIDDYVSDDAIISNMESLGDVFHSDGQIYTSTVVLL